jgi:antitoxin component YwqK of YwqJK toxin-antitoxin module
MTEYIFHDYIFPFHDLDNLDFINTREVINTSYYKNKKSLNILPEDILKNIFSYLKYYKNLLVFNYIDRDFNSRYPKKYLESISVIKQPHGIKIKCIDDDSDDYILETYRNGLLHGKYYKYKNYYKSKKNYVNGKKVGKSIKYDGKGKIDQIGVYKNGKKEGLFRVNSYDNCYRLINYKNGLLNGESKLYNNGKCLFSYNYKDGFLEGECIDYNRDIIELKNYKNGLLDGKYEEYFYNDDNILYLHISRTYKNNLKNGEFISYHSNGKINEFSNYSNNLYDGEYLQYRDTGILRVKKTFKKGIEVGTSSFYYPDGNIESITINNDLKTGVKKRFEYYKNGNINIINNYINDILEGEWSEYYEKGNVKSIKNYIENKIEGKVITYREDGTILSIENYEVGIKEHKSHYFTENGLRIKKYFKDEIISVV